MNEANYLITRDMSVAIFTKLKTTIEFPDLDSAVDHAMRWGGRIAREFDSPAPVKWFSCKFTMNDCFRATSDRSCEIGPWDNFVGD